MAAKFEDDTFLTQISVVSRRIKSEAERRLTKHGVHAGQQFILECLWRENGLTPGEIAQRIKVEAPTVSRAIQRMEAAGLVVVGADDNDGRRLRIWITRRAAALKKILPDVLSQLEVDALQALSPEEQQEFLRMLTVVAQTLNPATSDDKTLGAAAAAG